MAQKLKALQHFHPWGTMKTFVPSNGEISPDCRARLWRQRPPQEVAQCLTQIPYCPHRLECGDYHLCFHPGRDQIIVQTDLADKSAALNPTLPKANTIVAALRGKTPESGGRRPGVGTVDAR